MNQFVNIKDCGAIANLKTPQTDKIQSAIDFCFKKGGGTVIIPEGTFMTGDIRLRSNITLYLEKGAILKASQKPEDYFNYLNDNLEPLSSEQITDAPYIHLSTIHGETEYQSSKPEYRFKIIPGSRWNNAIIRAIDAENIAVIGENGSMIDGSNCFDEYGEEHYRGPHGMTLFNCKNVILSGYTIQDAGNWAHNLLFCDNISVNEITVLAGHDGFDASVCKNLSIINSKFYTGDDCIAGFGNVNTYVSNCILNSSCSAIRFGGSNAYISNCKIYGPGKYCFRGSLTDAEKRSMTPSATTTGRNNMLSVFTYYADYSLPINVQPGNIVISDCEITNADKLLHYNYSGNETWQKNRPLKSFELQNIKAEGISMPIVAYGDSALKIDLTLNNVDISLKKGFEDIELIHTSNYGNITLDKVSVSNHNSHKLIRAWSKGDIAIRNCFCFDSDDAVVYTDEKFTCKII